MKILFGIFIGSVAMIGYLYYNWTFPIAFLLGFIVSLPFLLYLDQRVNNLLLDKLYKVNQMNNDTELINSLKMKLHSYEEAIRYHRDQYLSGDNKCWQDNEELYKLLPEGYTPPSRDTKAELEMCAKYLESCHDPRIQYKNPQDRIKELEQLVASLTEELYHCNNTVELQSSQILKMRQHPELRKIPI